RIINYRIDLIHALGAGDAPAARLALLDLFIEDLREVFAAVLCQIIRIGNNSHAGNVVLERDIPEPSTAARRRSQYQSSSAISITLAVSALEIGIEHCLFKLWIANAPPKLV